MSALWIEEFSAEYQVPDIIANDPTLIDVSWHNDICPSFMTVELYERQARMTDGQLPDRRLWIEHVDPNQRQDSESLRFAVYDENGGTLFSSETDAAGAIAALKGGAR